MLTPELIQAIGTWIVIPLCIGAWLASPFVVNYDCDCECDGCACCDPDE
jgi:hypothetical protein